MNKSIDWIPAAPWLWNVAAGQSRRLDPLRPPASSGFRWFMPPKGNFSPWKMC